MALRIAINGFGRIGRCILRALYERGLTGQLQVVAINEPADCATMGYMLRYDSTHGRFQGEVSVAEDAMQGNGDHIAISHHTDITQLDWAAHNIDLVLECSGLYTTRDEVERVWVYFDRMVLWDMDVLHSYFNRLNWRLC